MNEDTEDILEPVFTKAGQQCPKCAGSMLPQWDEISRKKEIACINCGYIDVPHPVGVKKERSVR